MRYKNRPLLVVLGPTGVGKSELAVRLAETFEGEIISCDSMQVYKGFDIGTDKIPIGRRRGIPHHLLDVLDPDHQFTAADFAELAANAVSLILSRRRLPILAGGTGLYLKALLEGLFPGGRSDPELRARLRERADREGLEPLWNELKTIDPAYAGAIGPRDRVRILRALEVHAATGIPFSAHFPKTSSPVAGCRDLRVGLTLERNLLNERINHRVDRMFERGIVDETQRLLSRGVPADSPPFRALGYAQVLRHLGGEISLDEAIESTKQATRQYAKRQMTWFRRTPRVEWFSPGDTQKITAFVGDWIGSDGKGPPRSPLDRTE